MTIKLSKALTGLAAALAVSVCAAGFASAAPADYAFEPVKADIKTGSATELGVKLVNKTTGKPVEGAVLFRSRLDMSPDGMAEHTSSVEPLPAGGGGVYRFKGDVSMPGRWALKIMAKVPGETETVEGSIVFTAKD